MKKEKFKGFALPYSRPFYILNDEHLIEESRNQNPSFITIKDLKPEILSEFYNWDGDAILMYDNQKGYRKYLYNEFAETKSKHPVLKVGDYIEICSLLPAVVMDIDVEGDNISSRVLSDIEYTDSNIDGTQFSNCSLKNCGVRKLTFQQVINRLKLSKEKLIELYDESNSAEHYDFMVDQAANKI